ncbi:unnamed protein product [Phytomonas sp. Hart1]|nr:unnamed protein product [Phytomonas sp. Hart1]|eukprot:CCW69695.1 unnamed protein product [Phytomonas sp. isolate Hart1]
MVPPQLCPLGLLAVAEYLNVRGMVRQLRPRHRARRQLLFSWGFGGSGELGTQRFDDRDVPTPVRVAPFGVRITHLTLGSNYSCALSDDGNVYTFGNGDWGQLGLGDSRNLENHPCDKSAVVLVPRRVPLFERHRAVHISAGYAFVIAVVEGHRVYFWGNNNHGQSGLGPKYFDANSKKIDEPKLVESLEGKRVVQVGCGSFFTIALTADGRLYSWGLIECLGLGPPEAVRQRYHGSSILGESLSNERHGVLLTPQEVHVETASPLRYIHAGQWHSGVINAAGELFTWGVGYQGRLGHGTREPAYVPTLVRGMLAGHRVADVACGSFHTVALTDRGVVFCWGDNASGQCGTSVGHTEAVTSPYRVVGLEYVAGGVARAISCGRQNTLVVMENPQPGCTRRCCRFDSHHEGSKRRHSHGQVYTFGETPRGGGGGANLNSVASPGNFSFLFRTPNSTTSGTTGSSTSNRIVMRTGTHTGMNSGNGRGALSQSESSGMLDHQVTPQSRVVSAIPPPHRTSSQFRLVPNLENMDVRGIVSGLYHTFVYAEELDFSDEEAIGKEECDIMQRERRAARWGRMGRTPLSDDRLRVHLTKVDTHQNKHLKVMRDRE